MEVNAASGHTLYPCISVHIRRGDKSEEADPTNTTIYVSEVRKFVSSHAVRNWTILLLTDEVPVSLEFMKLLHEHQVVMVSAITSR